MANALKKGDKVVWETSQGQTQGTVVRKVTGTSHAKGHVAKASCSDPQYEVKSDSSGQGAIHKPAALHKAKGR